MNGTTLRALGALCLLGLAGAAQAQPAPGQPPATQPPAAQPPAASAPAAAPAGSAATIDLPFVASRKSRKYYRASCPVVRQLAPTDTVGFESMAAAEKAGFRKDLYGECKY
jgi:hypothetical protein